MNQHIRSGPPSQRDWSTMTGAHDLANMIRLFWAVKGKFPKLTIEKETSARIGGETGLYCVRSDMAGGLPR